MLQLHVAVERQTAVAEKWVILSSHADQPLAERRAFNQCPGNLGEIANRKIKPPVSHHVLDVLEVWSFEQDLYVRGVGGQCGHQGRDEDVLHEVIAMEVNVRWLVSGANSIGRETISPMTAITWSSCSRSCSARGVSTKPLAPRTRS